MIKKLIKILIAITLTISLSTFAFSDDHKSSKEIINDLKLEIKELNAKPVKSKLFQRNSKYIEDLKEQRDILLKEKKRKEKIESIKKELIKEIEALGGKPKIDTSDVDSDKEITDLKKQLQDIKNKNKEKKKAEEKKRERDKAIETIKKELIFLGEAPISEYEFSNNDEYITALKEQIEDIKTKNAAEEQKLKDSIPEWYGMAQMPKNTDTTIYAKGTHTSADLDQSELIGLEKAKAKLAGNLASIMSLKIEIAVNEKVIDVDSAFKSEITSISKSVAKEVSIGGYKVYKSATVELSNGKFRNYIIIEFPVTVAYTAFLNDIKNNPATKDNIKKIKDTEVFKELELLITGA